MTEHAPVIVLAIAEPEYQTRLTLPAFAARLLHAEHGFEVVEVGPDPVVEGRLAGFAEGLERADLLVLSIRRRALPADEMAALKAYLGAGKPLVGLRTANHAFFPRGPYPEGYETWEGFDPEVIGGNYSGHHGHDGRRTTVTVHRDAPADAPILAGVDTPFTGHSALYKVSPLRETATPLLIGRIEGAAPEPVAWTHTYGRSKVFYTSLGHPDDFRERSFVRLLHNAILWGLKRED